MDEIIGDHQGGFRLHRSTRDLLHSSYIGEKSPVHQLFADFKKAYDSVRREVL
jgi:hypothetical protein